MKPFEQLLEGASEFHGHMCPGQVVGVRMAILGCRLIGLEDPSSPEQIKKLIVFVEMDRCTADAVAYVTGVKLGRRSLKFRDYGIMAATFLNLETGKAVRVLSTEESRDLAAFYAKGISTLREQQITAYKTMPDNVLFRVFEVSVTLNESDYPGPSGSKFTCMKCGQVIRDNRQVNERGLMVCKPCTDDCYFKEAREITWPEMQWSPS